MDTAVDEEESMERDALGALVEDGKEHSNDSQSPSRFTSQKHGKIH